MIAVAFASCENTYTAQHAAGINLRDELLCRFGLNPADYIYQRTKEGKPFAVNTPFHFSISHSGTLCCCALSAAAPFSKRGETPIFSSVALWPDKAQSKEWQWTKSILFNSNISGNVGIDLEKIDEGADLSRLVKITNRYLYGVTAPSDITDFYRMWTRQEAFGKFTGQGFLAKPTPDIALSSYRVQQKDCTYYLSIAYKPLGDMNYEQNAIL